MFICTAKDAADIGFRDDFIYKFIEGKCSDASVLDLVPQDHDMTIKTFEAFAQKQDKTIY